MNKKKLFFFKNKIDFIDNVKISLMIFILGLKFGLSFVQGITARELLSISLTIQILKIDRFYFTNLHYNKIRYADD